MRRLFGRRAAAVEPPTLSADVPTAVRESLGFLRAHPDWYAIFEVDVARNYYVQALGPRDDEPGFHVEAVSDRYLQDADRLSAGAIATFTERGWALDDTGGNWTKHLDANPHSDDAAANELIEVMTDVFGWRSGDPVKITMDH